MKAVVTVEEMRAIDEASLVPTGVLIDRAGAAVARTARSMLGGTYGRRVVVVAGKGNNGADGRVAATRLAARGVRVEVIDAATAGGSTLPACDLVIDAAYGTGFHGEYEAPDPREAPVLAVDIPSGVNGDTGEAGAGAVRADETVTFAALKPGLLLGDGFVRSGRVTVADVGLDVPSAASGIALVEDEDVADALPPIPREGHKWQMAVYVIAGSPGMMGAAWLTSRAAMRSGAGYVRLGTPGAEPQDFLTGEVVSRRLPADGWAAEVLSDIERFRVLVVGPGLGQSEATATEVKRLVAEAPIPVVVDADGLNALGVVGGALTPLAAIRIVTPHDGEFARLAGSAPGPGRIEAVRALAGRSGATVLLKGATTVVAGAGGVVRLAAAGDARLATAGTGDVLTGVVAGFIAAGVEPSAAPSLAAHAHGRAASLGFARGLVAGDLLELLPRYLSSAGAGAGAGAGTGGQR